MAIIEGYIAHIRFRNEENGYTVLTLETADDEETCVGNFHYINEGEYMRLEGEYVDHHVHGPQFKVDTYEVKAPEGMKDIERYLGSGSIKGLGPVLAKRLVKKFKMDTFRIIEEEPERLVEIKGISKRLAQEIAVQFQEKREMREAMIFLAQYGIATNYAVKIYNEYGDNLYKIVKENPYQLAEDITGIGFKIADEIAEKVGILSNSDFRLRSGLLYTMQQASYSGHTSFPKERLLFRGAELLGVTPDVLEAPLMDLLIERKLVAKVMNEQEMVYTFHNYYTEMSVAKKLLDLNIEYDLLDTNFELSIKSLEKSENIQYDELQKEAILKAAKNGVLVVTGGPGTGKTTTINGIIRYFEREGMDIMLAAPTGRAAKRMAEATGYEAKTIHRLLELNGNPEGDMKLRFEKNEQNPLETDVIIIDEMSMVDLSLMNSLLCAVLSGTRLVLVGDSNQLPSVGAGNVLKDLIESKCFPVVELNKIFRQAETSDIVVNAHRIHQGQNIVLDNKSQDFFFLKRLSVQEILGVVIYLVRDKLPNYVDATPFDIQVLTPMRKGELGVEKLNVVLQQYLNPPSPEKKEKEVHLGILREGDKVMQIKNNYQIEWEITNGRGYVLDTGVGIFNGDVGVIREINTFAEEVIVVFDEVKVVKYPFGMLEELELAYAVTIHKSQGSEYPAVVIPLLSGPPILLNRNLLYTAVTRAKKCVTIVGSSDIVGQMIRNVNQQLRYTGLATQLKEIKDVALI